LPVLTLQNGERAGAAFPFERPVVLGRGRRADIVVDDPSASRRHAQIELHGRDWQLHDLESANGTHLNGRPISRPTTIEPGDLIGIGGLTLRFEPDVRKETGDTVFFIEEDSPVSQIILSRPVDEELPPPTDPRQLHVLNRLAELLATAFQEGAVLDFVLDELLKIVPRSERGLVLVYEVEGGELVPRSIRAPGGAPARVGYSRTLLKQALARREGLVIIDASNEAKASSSETMLSLGHRSVLCVPITFRNEVFGVLQLDAAPGSGAFNEAELATALGFAGQIGMSIAYVRLHERELKRELLDRDLKLARRVQQDFLPQRPPEIEGYAFAVEYTPALQVGGDFFDFIQLSATHIAVIGGDVSGKGVSAAIFGARVTSDFRYQSVGQTSPSTILERVNKSLTHVSRDAMFATAMVAVIDTTTGQVEIATAAHPLGVLRSASGWARLVGATGGPPIGIRDRATFPQTSHPLAPGDSIVFYSDGVTEAINIGSDQYGNERLLAAIRPVGGTVRELTRALADDVQRFSTGCEQRDDITIVAFGRSK
jgi:sigma-B regulation protein RsbU (phosphoserine phosphatase)